MVGAAHRALLLRGLQLVTEDDDHRHEEAEQRWLETPRVRAVRETIRRFQDAEDELRRRGSVACHAGRPRSVTSRSS